MKQALITLIITLLVTVTIFAKDVSYSACTEDGKVVTLGVSFYDEALVTNHPVELHVKMSFEKTSSLLSSEALVGSEGFEVFTSFLDATDMAAISDIAGPPSISGACQ